MAVLLPSSSQFYHHYQQQLCEDKKDMYEYITSINDMHVAYHATIFPCPILRHTCTCTSVKSRGYVHLLINHSSLPRPLLGHRDCINTLVGSGADFDAKDKKQYTPLHAAAAGGQCHSVKLLLELGANVSHIPYSYVSTGSGPAPM